MKNKKPFSFKSLFVSIFVFSFLFLCGCQSAPAIKETEEFYINDRPHILLNATKWTILTYSEELYDDSQTEEFKDAKINGAQVVVATYLGDSNIDTTDIFNSWGIGENDMGVLIVLFFSKTEEDYAYQSIVFEIGEKMSGYFSAFTASNLISEYFDDSAINSGDYDQRLMALYFAVMEHIYLQVYNYDSYNYQSFMDEYATNKYEYFDLLPSDYEPEPLPNWAWALIITGIVLLGIVPSGFIIKHIATFISRGGGGHSGGYWFRH